MDGKHHWRTVQKPLAVGGFFQGNKVAFAQKTFIGITQNVAMMKIWTALVTILILKALKAIAKIGCHLSNLVTFIRLNLFVKINLYQWLDKQFDEVNAAQQNDIQGVLF